MQKCIPIFLIIFRFLGKVHVSSQDYCDYEEPIYKSSDGRNYIELILVADNSVYLAMDRNFSQIYEFCKNIGFYLDQMFIPFNISIALKDVIVWDQEDEILIYGSSNITLLNFLEYRTEKLLPTNPNDYAHLLTMRQLDSGVLGRSYKNFMCSSYYSGGISTASNGSVAFVASIVAHEMGHNLGLVHDTTDCKCGDKLCLMSATLGENEIDYLWSNCSINEFSHFEIPKCLRNFPMKRFQEPVCGNHIREIGEDCDCGLPNICKAPCCNSRTCKFHKKGVICRAAKGGCDIAEYCTGYSLQCPFDKKVNEIEVCGKTEAICYQGSCETRDDQCKKLWGRYAKESRSCHQKNLSGTREGNCGFNENENRYIPCEQEDSKCGTLHCHRVSVMKFKENEIRDIVFGSVRIETGSSSCLSVIFKENLSKGYAGDGTICGERKVCMSQKCVSIDAIKQQTEF